MKKNYKTSGCNHKIKRWFTHGRNSIPKWVCKECGKLLSRNELIKERRTKWKR